MFWIALAAQMSMPLPDRGFILDVFDYTDVPMDLIHEGEVRRVDVRLTVNSQGKIIGCGIAESSGISKLDAYTCAIIRRRAKLHPAVWNDGSPGYGVIRKIVTWSVGALPSPPPTDIQLTVNRMPQGAKSPALVQVMFAVDEVGTKMNCTEESRPNQSVVTKAPQLLSISCAAIMKSFVATPARDEGGRAVRSIQNATVSFVTDRR